MTTTSARATGSLRGDADLPTSEVPSWRGGPRRVAVDHHDHEAILAIDPESGRTVGVARYVHDPKRRDSAEVAFAVLESWQGRGIGTALMRGLADRARVEGISRFTALMLAHNSPMRHLLAELGPIRVLSRDAGAVELAVELDPGPP